MNSPKNFFATKELIQSASASKPFKASAGDADQVVLAAADRASIQSDATINCMLATVQMPKLPPGYYFSEGKVYFVAGRCPYRM